MARIYEFVNALAQPLTNVAAGKADAAYIAAVRDAAEILLHLIAPMTPHLAEECWTVLGKQGLVAEARWPVFDKDLVRENEITLPCRSTARSAPI